MRTVEQQNAILVEKCEKLERRIRFLRTALHDIAATKAAKCVQGVAVCALSADDDAANS